MGWFLLIVSLWIIGGSIDERLKEMNEILRSAESGRKP